MRSKIKVTAPDQGDVEVTVYRSNGSTQAKAYTTETGSTLVSWALTVDAGTTTTMWVPVGAYVVSVKTTDDVEFAGGYGETRAVWVDNDGVDLRPEPPVGSGGGASAIAGALGQIWPNTTDQFNARYGGASTTTQTDWVTFTPITPVRACVLATVGLVCSSAVAGSTIGIAIYRSASDGRPGTLETDFGTVDTTSLGLKTITGLSVAIAAGETVWFATVGGATPGQAWGLVGSTSGGIAGAVAPGVSSDNLNRNGFYNVGTSGSAFPASPTVLLTTGTNIDMVNLQFSFSSVS